jgi:trigger factor
MQLQKEVKKEPNAKISIQVTIDKESIREVRESVIRDFEQKAKISGFRQGKVPRNIVVNRFSDNIKNETLSQVLSKSLSEILQETEYRPISEPSITEMGEMNPDEDFTFTAECDIMPEVKLPEYRGVSSEKYIYDVKDSTIKWEIENLRERFSNLVSIDRKAALGDYVVIDYVEEDDSGKKSEKKENQTILLDKKEDQLAKQLIGLKGGDTKTVELEHEYTEDKKKHTYKVKVHVDVKEVKIKELPELNDDFAKDISDVESLAELRKKVKEDLQEEATRKSEEHTKDELMKKLIKRIEYDIPETLVNHEIERILNDVAYSYRIDLENLRKDEQRYREYRESLRPRALDTLKWELALAEIAKQESLAIEAREVDDEIKRYAKSQKKKFDELKKQMEQRDTIESLKYRMKIAKALNFVYQNAKLEQEKHIKFGEEEKK